MENEDKEMKIGAEFKEEFISFEVIDENDMLIHNQGQVKEEVLDPLMQVKVMKGLNVEDHSEHFNSDSKEVPAMTCSASICHPTPAKKRCICSTASRDSSIEENEVQMEIPPTKYFEMKCLRDDRAHHLDQCMAAYGYCEAFFETAELSFLHQFPEGVSRAAITDHVKHCFGWIGTRIGSSNANRFFSHLNISPASYPTFNSWLHAVVPTIQLNVDNLKIHVAKVVSNFYRETYRLGGFDGNINVSFERAWMPRGYSSQYGVFFITDNETGIVLDYYVVSKYCHECKQKKRMLPFPTFILWYREHKKSDFCRVNCDTWQSSGGMEAFAAKLMFQRSVKNKLRYSIVTSEMGSSTFSSLTNANVYGDDYPIVKVNCLDDFTTEICKELNDCMVEQEKHEDSEKEGRLTPRVINNFISFYKDVVDRSNGCNGRLIKEILTFVHLHCSTEEKTNKHKFCNGEWCTYQKKMPRNMKPQRQGNTTIKTYVLSKQSVQYVLCAVLDYMRKGITNQISKKKEKKKYSVIETLQSRIKIIAPHYNHIDLDALKYAVCQTVILHNYRVANSLIFP